MGTHYRVARSQLEGGKVTPLSMALRILWELSIAKGPLTFRGLQAAAQTNPSVLNKRLKELRDGRLVAHNGQGYQLTARRNATPGAVSSIARLGGRMGITLEE